MASQEKNNFFEPGCLDHDPNKDLMPFWLPTVSNLV
jgi:hypothetical protein